ncbi:nascent polypeptide-associated complex subunit alpha [Drosophila pseudoobscura]|uniref:Nascent polypeptide-associated complex subunit alpha n=1 Tax=Drosophila pseudoobscura pseudoobscura TaxID=46245 RepID=Q29LI6_DROPS|nr:nascent polypeptide-associated complex subunit alpha [Drosophila pseudoobscura]
MGKKQKNQKAAATAAATASATAAATAAINVGEAAFKAATKDMWLDKALTFGRDEEAPSTSKKSKNPDYNEAMQQLMEMTKKYPQLGDHACTALSDDEVDSDDDVTDAVGSLDPQAGAMPLGAHRQSRGEKKARRLLSKLDLKPVENVSRVTMRKNKNILLYIDQPDVFKVGDSYLCFGDVKVEDITQMATAQAAERFRENATAADQSEREALAWAKANENDQEEPEFDEELLMELDDKDIDLVQMQATCSRTKAIKALLDNENDVVNAIMALTLASN